MARRFERQAQRQWESDVDMLGLVRRWMEVVCEEGQGRLVCM